MPRNHADQYWLLNQLIEEAARVLALDKRGSVSGRVRELPDIRTVRYYTTLGLIDKPEGRFWKNALYCRRHLLQLVAIKRLQVQGLTLEEIQQELVGKPNSVLERFAQLPADIGDSPSPMVKRLSKQEVRAEQEQRRGAFWSEAPAEAPEGQPPSAPPVLRGIPLREDVTLLLTSLRELGPDDLEAIQAAAAPLLKLLEKRRLM